MKKKPLTISLVLGLLLLRSAMSANAESFILGDIAFLEVNKKGYYRERERRELKPVNSHKASEDLTRTDQRLWAINVLSVQNPASISPYMELLTQNGFHTYITMVEVNGKEWARLGVGFFEARVEAERNMEEIMSLLGMTSRPWLSRSPIQKPKDSPASE